MSAFLKNSWNGEDFLPAAFFISLTVHTVFICSSLFWQMPQAKKENKDRGVEVNYRTVPPRPPDMRERPIKPAQKLDLKNAAATRADGTIPMNLGKEAQGLRNFTMYERKPEQIRSTQMTHKVSIMPLQSEKVNNPAYTTYEDMLRNRIRDKVYENFNKMESGSVYLTFVIGSDGVLKASQVLDDRSRASQNLKDISLKSLQQARFPPFLKGMSLPEYTFNIEIQYQVR